MKMMDYVSGLWPQTSTEGGKLLRGAFAEFVGSFFVLWIGHNVASTIGTVAAASGVVMTSTLLLGPAFAASTIAMTFAFSELSGAHFNPVVTLALLLTGNCSADRAVCYWLAHFISAFVATGFVRLSVGDGLFESGMPSGSPMTGGQLFLQELFGSALWVLTVMCCGTWAAGVSCKEAGWDAHRSPPAAVAPLAVGFAVGAATLAAAPCTGGFFNPARALAAAVYEGETGSDTDGFNEKFWIYWVGPICGAALAALCFCLAFRTPQMIYPHDKQEKDACERMEMMHHHHGQHVKGVGTSPMAGREGGALLEEGEQKKQENQEV